MGRAPVDPPFVKTRGCLDGMSVSNLVIAVPDVGNAGALSECICAGCVVEAHTKSVQPKESDVEWEMRISEAAEVEC